MKTENILSIQQHSSGFYDSAHLSNSYQKMLGISPSTLIRKLDRFEV